MIIYFRILSDEVEDFVKEIAIDENQTFEDLHNFIQEILSYDASQMASFFTTDNDWNKEMEITLFDMTESISDNLRVMSETRLSEFINDAGQRMLYVFDFFSERVFFIETIQISEGNMDKPNCYRNEGEAPQQIMLGNLTGDIDNESVDMYDEDFDDILDSPDFNSLDDLDLDNEDLSDFY